METKEYYEPFSEEMANELKLKIIETWVEVGNDPNYILEKIKIVINTLNYQDNLIGLIGLFDFNNQKILSSKLSIKLKIECMNKYLSVNTDLVYCPFFY